MRKKGEVLLCHGNSPPLQLIQLQGEGYHSLDSFVTYLPHNVKKSKNNITKYYINQITAAIKFASYAKEPEIKSYA